MVWYTGALGRDQVFDAAGSWELEGTPPRFFFLLLHQARRMDLFRQPLPGRPRPHRTADGFSLVEVLIAVSILAMAASALLLATEASAESSRSALERTIASGIATQLVDEMLGLPYNEKSGSPFDWPLQPEVGELTEPVQRARFDDTDDFNGYQAVPLEDAWSVPLGTGDDAGGLRRSNFALPTDYFADWSVSIEVRYADEANPSLDLPAGSTSGLRALFVTVSRLDGSIIRNLVTIRRVFSHVPQPS